MVSRVVRHGLLSIAALLFVLAGPTLAHAWSNGPGGDGFGTHDWILYEGARVARVQGHDWVDLKVALPMTDDPDTRLHDTYYHVFQLGQHRYGASPTKVAALYTQAVGQLRAGDRIGASRTVGLLAHYFGDTNNPLHTDQVATEERIHSRYEQTVDKLTDAPGENSGWLGLMHFSRVTDPAAFTITDAQLAHGSYAALVAGFAVQGYDASVDAITRKSLNRAVEGVADIIGSIQLDAGYRTVGDGKAAVPTATAESTGAAPSTLGAVQDAMGSGDPVTSASTGGAGPAIGETTSPDASTTESDGSPGWGSVALGAAGACCGLLLVVVAVALLLWARKRRR